MYSSTSLTEAATTHPPPPARFCAHLLLLLLLPRIMLSIHPQSPEETSHSDSIPAPHASHSTPQTTQEDTEAVSIHSLPIGHVSTAHAPPQRPSTARSPPSSDAYATPPSPLHTQSASVSASMRRSAVEVNFRVLFLRANPPEH